MQRSCAVAYVRCGGAYVKGAREAKDGEVVAVGAREGGRGEGAKGLPYFHNWKFETRNLKGS